MEVINQNELFQLTCHIMSYSC